jgi:hypothetical protein
MYIHAKNQNFRYSLLDGGVPSALFHRKERQHYWKEGWVGHSDSLNGLGKRTSLPVSRMAALQQSLLNFIKICSVKHALSVIKRH